MTDTNNRYNPSVSRPIYTRRLERQNPSVSRPIYTRRLERQNPSASINNRWWNRNITFGRGVLKCNGSWCVWV